MLVAAPPAIRPTFSVQPLSAICGSLATSVQQPHERRPPRRWHSRRADGSLACAATPRKLVCEPVTPLVGPRRIFISVGSPDDGKRAGLGYAANDAIHQRVRAEGNRSPRRRRRQSVEAAAASCPSNSQPAARLLAMKPFMSEACRARTTDRFRSTSAKRIAASIPGRRPAPRRLWPDKHHGPLPPPARYSPSRLALFLADVKDELPRAAPRPFKKSATHSISGRLELRGRGCQNEKPNCRNIETLGVHHAVTRCFSSVENVARQQDAGTVLFSPRH